MNRLALYSLALLVLLVDQITKWRVERGFLLGESRPVLPGFFSLTLVHNTGGAFGILPTGTLGLAGAALVAAIAIVIYTARARMPLPPLLAVTLALPLGGSLGNLLDRVRLRYVVDFFDLHWHNAYQFPVFNVADSAICIGVALLAWHFWRQPVGDKTPAAPVQKDTSAGA